jgi:hypothetical protein
VVDNYGIDRRHAFPYSRNSLVMEHTNITEITYSGGGGGRILEESDVEEMSTSASTSINSFSPDEYFDSVRFMDYREHDSRSHTRTQTDRGDANCFVINKYRDQVPQQGIKLVDSLEDKQRKQEKDGSSALCSRLKVMKSPESEGTNASRQEQEYEYLVCKNVAHAARGDHCNPARLYTIKKSTMPPSREGGVGRGKSRKKVIEIRIDVLSTLADPENDNWIDQKHRDRRGRLNYTDSLVDPANITVRTRRTGSGINDVVTGKVFLLEA